ncbi:MAG TPA: YdeI/OmpD-associated family protein [Pyrinomonadaceae bacterium]|jgi:bifunctional DNA-binding transcriptional regulator/antitoxin component of YhaV-PrlF toxin-antitoxin module
MAEKQIFEVVLEKHEKLEATGITIPFDVEEVFGAKRVPVKVCVNGADYRGTICRMGGKYVLGVPKVFREAAGVKAGETITVEMERDTEKRVVEPPEDLARALNKNSEARNAWEKLSYTHKKEFARALEEAKRAETRERRLYKTIEELLKKKK